MIDGGDDGEPSITIPRWGPIRVQVDRRLSPASVSRTTVRLVSGTVGEFVFPSFDPVRGELLIELSRPLAVGAFYALSLSDLVDLDGTALGSPVQFLFKVVPADAPTAPDPMVRPAEVVAMLANRCATGGCHDTSVHAASLVLDSSDGIALTALGMPSRQAVSPGATARAGSPGLVGLSIVDPERSSASPSRSYLIYKALGDSHVLGEAMPPPSHSGPLTQADLLDISRWIAAGSPLE